jgi:hypothetical protein
VSDNIRFTPYSLDSFKRTSRDLQRAFPIGLQESQEILAKLYGYPHLHALQEHLKNYPAPGLEDGSSPFFLDDRAATNFYELTQRKVFPLGRMGVEDIGIFQPPAERQEIMRVQKEIESAIDGAAPPELNAEPNDYVWFQDRPDPDGSKLREGVFRLTKKGDSIWKACCYLNDVLHYGEASGRDARQLQAMHKYAADSMHHMLELFPNNPYVKANWIWACSEDREEFSLEFASDLWPIAQEARKQFESIMSHRFSGYIEQKLVGFGAENQPYFAVLYFGAHFASRIGLQHEALKWARRSLRFSKNDNFGIRFLADALKNGDAD